MYCVESAVRSLEFEVQCVECGVCKLSKCHKHCKQCCCKIFRARDLFLQMNIHCFVKKSFVSLIILKSFLVNGSRKFNQLYYEGVFSEL